MICIPAMSMRSRIWIVKGSHQEVVVPRPVALGDDRGFVILIDPAADHPLQVFQLIVMRRWS